MRICFSSCFFVLYLYKEFETQTLRKKRKKKMKKFIGRLRVETNKEKLADAKEWAYIYKVNCDIYREKKNSISDPIAKAEARVTYERDHANMHRELRKITKYGILLGYTEQEIDTIKESVFWPEGKPQVRDIAMIEEFSTIDFN